MRERRATALRRISAPPVRGGKSPSDLEHRPPEQRVGAIQSDEADELSDTRDLDGPEPEALRQHLRDDAVEPGVGFRARVRGWEMLHHSRIRVHRRERSAVTLAPRTKH